MNFRMIAAAAAACLLAAAAARAEVKTSTPSGFTLEARTIVKATPVEAWFILGQPGQWWSPEHTYSGFAANLSLDKRAGSCFCETARETGATIEHGRVIYADPNALLRLRAALGPLQKEAVTGILTWTLKEVPGGTEIVQTYAVGGYFATSAQKLAPLVDKVLTEQLARFRDRLASGRPPATAEPDRKP